MGTAPPVKPEGDGAAAGRGPEKGGASRAASYGAVPPEWAAATGRRPPGSPFETTSQARHAPA